MSGGRETPQRQHRPGQGAQPVAPPASSARRVWYHSTALFCRERTFMPSRYPYQVTIRNEYLGVSKVIRAMTRQELNWLVEAQLAKWREQAHRKRQQKEKEAERLAA